MSVRTDLLLAKTHLRTLDQVSKTLECLQKYLKNSDNDCSKPGDHDDNSTTIYKHFDELKKTLWEVYINSLGESFYNDMMLNINPYDEYVVDRWSSELKDREGDICYSLVETSLLIYAALSDGWAPERISIVFDISPETVVAYERRWETLCTELDYET
jgi:hypothetical protein